MWDRFISAYNVHKIGSVAIIFFQNENEILAQLNSTQFISIQLISPQIGLKI